MADSACWLRHIRGGGNVATHAVHASSVLFACVLAQIILDQELSGTSIFCLAFIWTPDKPVLQELQLVAGRRFLRFLSYTGTWWAGAKERSILLCFLLWIPVENNVLFIYYFARHRFFFLKTTGACRFPENILTKLH